MTDIVTAPLRAASDEVMKGVPKWVADGASRLVGQAGKLIDETTTPRIASPWFTGQYGSMAGLAAVFALPLLLLSVLQWGAASRRGDRDARCVRASPGRISILTAGPQRS